MTATRTALELKLDAPLAELGEALAAHGHDYTVAGAACRCGFQGKSNRAVGLHVSAAAKRAEKAYDVAAKAALEELGAMTYAERRQLEDEAEAGAAANVVEALTERRRPASYFAPEAAGTIARLIEAGRVTRFLDGAEEWLELTDAERGLEPIAVELEGTLTLEHALTVRTGDDTGELLPAGTAIGVASTLSDDVLAVLVVDPGGRQLLAGEAARVDVEAALRPAPRKGPKRVDAATFTRRPVRDLGGRLRRIARNAERGAGYLRRSGRPAHADLAGRLEQAAGRKGSAAANGAGRRLGELITALDNTTR